MKNKSIAQSLANEMKAENAIILEVTTTTCYLVPNGYAPDGIKALTDEWFKDFNINRYHATRNACEIGGSKKVVKVKVMKGK